MTEKLIDFAIRLGAAFLFLIAAVVITFVYGGKIVIAGIGGAFLILCGEPFHKVADYSLDFVGGW